MRDLEDLARTWWARASTELPDSKISSDPHVISLITQLLRTVRDETIEDCAWEALDHTARTGDEEMLRADIVDSIRAMKGGA